MKFLIKNSYFSLITLFFASYAFAIDPVEIGKKYQEDLEINLSVIENLNKNLYEQKIEIKKDIRTKIKKKDNVILKKEKLKNKNEIKIEKSINKQLARIQSTVEEIPNQIQIFFNSNTANLKEDDSKKIKDFINNKIDKKNLNFKITSYAKTNKSEDASRRLSLDRAINIRSILLDQGIPAKNLIVKSFGDAKNKENKVIIEFEKR